jgi:hypothetical protein
MRCWPIVASPRTGAVGPVPGGPGWPASSCHRCRVRWWMTAVGCWLPGHPIARLDREIAALAKPDPRVQALMTLPGVGRLTAMRLVAEIGDSAASPRPASCAPWAGLTPRSATPTVRSATATSPNRARCGWVGSCSRPPRRPSATPCWPAPTPAGPPPRQQHRHHRDRPPAAGPLLPHPQAAGGSTTGEGHHRARSRFRMRLQHRR